MLYKWKVTSSHSKSEIPNIWELETNSFTIKVHRYIYSPYSWFVSCRALGIGQKFLESKELADAQKEAIRVVVDKITDLWLDAKKIE